MSHAADEKLDVNILVEQVNIDGANNRAALWLYVGSVGCIELYKQRTSARLSQVLTMNCDG
jgi:hypothetical protein